MIAAGGTGGHIFPALAIGEELRRQRADAKILFVGTDRGLEERVFVGHGFALRILRTRGFIRGWAPMDVLKNVLLPFRLVGVMAEARKLLREFAPGAVIGCGGYVTGPVVFVAARRKVPTLIQEQNSRPGRTTQILSRFVDEVHLTYEEAARFLSARARWTVSGNPIRANMKLMDRAAAAAEWNLDPAKNILLVVGGSLGARSINETIADSINSLSDHTQIVWQTGPSDLDRMRARVGTTAGVRVIPFVEDMAAAYSCADLVVCRAGAMTLSELTLMGKPSILVPYPYAADNHQEFNAQSLVRRGAAVMVRNSEIHTLGPAIVGLLNDPERLRVMAQESFALRQPDAAATIVRALLQRLN